jgi:hypothetical protein
MHLAIGAGERRSSRMTPYVPEKNRLRLEDRDQTFGDDLRQEPASTLGLVEPVLDQVGSGDIVRAHVSRAGFASARGCRPEAHQHIVRRDEFGIVVRQALMPRGVGNRSHGGSAELPGSLCNLIGHREDLHRLLAKEPVVVTKVRPGHLPVKVPSGPRFTSRTHPTRGRVEYHVGAPHQDRS